MLPSLPSTARGAVGRYRAYRDLKWRRIPTIDVRPARGSSTVYYLVPDVATPHGGVRVAYRHVDLLNALGQPAAVLHDTPGFRATWFPNSTRVLDTRTLRFGADDLLVVPEVYGPSMHSIDPEARVLVFNQGAYITFDALDPDRTRDGSPYREIGRLEGIMTVSRDSADLLSLSFPDVPIDIARPVVDGSIFHPGRQPGGRAFGYVLTRRQHERNQVLHLLRARGLTWEPVPLTGMSETQMAETLRRTAVFLSLSDRDGFGLPPAEAMASGCYVVGYPGGGGEEFFDPDYCAPARSTAELVRALERAMTTSPAELAAAGGRASAAILDRYHADGLRQDLERIFTPLVLGR
jgi:glycosyltransferase involved in cell wall biosynthesis